jgi:hypothetical protein
MELPCSDGAVREAVEATWKVWMVAAFNESIMESKAIIVRENSFHLELFHVVRSYQALNYLAFRAK